MNSNNIGEARRAYEKRNGTFTQKDAAEYFGVSLGTYRNWEQGRTGLNLGILSRIAEKYSVTVDYLLMREPNTDMAMLSNVERTIIERYRALSADDKAVFYGLLEALSK